MTDPCRNTCVVCGVTGTDASWEDVCGMVPDGRMSMQELRAGLIVRTGMCEHMMHRHCVASLC